MGDVDVGLFVDVGFVVGVDVGFVEGINEVGNDEVGLTVGNWEEGFADTMKDGLVDGVDEVDFAEGMNEDGFAVVSFVGTAEGTLFGTIDGE